MKSLMFLVMGVLIMNTAFATQSDQANFICIDANETSKIILRFYQNLGHERGIAILNVDGNEQGFGVVSSDISDPYNRIFMNGFGYHGDGFKLRSSPYCVECHRAQLEINRLSGGTELYDVTCLRP